MKNQIGGGTPKFFCGFRVLGHGPELMEAFIALTTEPPDRDVKTTQTLEFYRLVIQTAVRSALFDDELESGYHDIT